MCPLTCGIVKDAIQKHEEFGVIIGEYIDYHKRHNALCLLCKRNELSSMPEHLKKDVAAKESW